MLSITGERVQLRDLRPEDLEDFHRLASDPELMEYSRRQTGSVEESAAFIERAIAENEKGSDRKAFFFAIELREPRSFIGDGFVTVHEKNATGGIASIGYFLFAEFQGRGYATEAARLMLDYGFSQLGLHRIIAECDQANTASERVMLKCGMQKEAEYRQMKYNGQNWVGRVGYAILKEDWERVSRPD